MPHKTHDRFVVYAVRVGINPRLQWRWRRYAANNRIVGSSSEAYTSRKRCIENAILHGAKEPTIEVKPVPPRLSGGYYGKGPKR